MDWENMKAKRTQGEGQIKYQPRNATRCPARAWISLERHVMGQRASVLAALVRAAHL